MPRHSKRIDPWLELGFAVLLAATTVLSAWCAYQATVWEGVQQQAFSEADAARAEATRLDGRANHVEATDLILFTEYWSALVGGRDALADQFYRRFPPTLKAATDAWLATRPLENPTAPGSPFDLPQYRVAEREEADGQLVLAETKVQAARVANERSDTYVALTVIFASVLFVEAVGHTFESRTLRALTLLVGGLLLAAVVFGLIALVWLK